MRIQHLTDFSSTCSKYFLNLQADHPSYLLPSHKYVGNALHNSNILILTICFMAINFTFQILPLFVPAASSSFMSYTAHFPYINLASFL